MAALRWSAPVHNEKLSKLWLHHRVLLGTLLFSVGQRHSKGARLWRTIHRRAFEVHQLLQEEVPRLCYNCCPVSAKKTKSKSGTATGFFKLLRLFRRKQMDSLLAVFQQTALPQLTSRWTERTILSQQALKILSML